jgi:hypothetical protein
LPCFHYAINKAEQYKKFVIRCKDSSFGGCGFYLRFVTVLTCALWCRDQGKPAARRGRKYQGPLAKERQPGCRKECLRCARWSPSRRRYRSALAWQPYVPRWLEARITNRTQRAGEHGMSGRYEEAEELKIGEGGP